MTALGNRWDAGAIEGHGVSKVTSRFLAYSGEQMVLLHAGIKNAGRKVEGRLLQFGKHSTSETTVRPSNTAIKKSDLGSEEVYEFENNTL